MPRRLLSDLLRGRWRGEATQGTGRGGNGINPSDVGEVGFWWTNAPGRSGELEDRTVLTYYYDYRFSPKDTYTTSDYWGKASTFSIRCVKTDEQTTNKYTTRISGG